MFCEVEYWDLVNVDFDKSCSLEHERLGILSNQVHIIHTTPHVHTVYAVFTILQVAAVVVNTNTYCYGGSVSSAIFHFVRLDRNISTSVVHFLLFAPFYTTSIA